MIDNRFERNCDTGHCEYMCEDCGGCDCDPVETCICYYDSDKEEEEDGT